VTGGRAELFISGGAPLSKDIAEFFFRAGFKILEGYGLSETCILSVNRVERFRFGTVGHPFEHTEIKIAEDGEICVRGPQVMQGYYKRPDATAEVFDSEGWFKTGDIGEIDSQGFIRITDRKKELIATAGGKKIAPQPVENFLKSDPLVESACLVGDRRKYITVLLVPNLEMVRSWASRRGLSLSSLAECAESEALQSHFSSLVQSANKDLPQYSTIKDFRILDKPFAVETGELTPTLKLKRRIIQERYAAVIDSMYPQEEEKLVI
jgi:long-chain acyl-CoA synthetase